jgi:hypothetical protein
MEYGPFMMSSFLGILVSIRYTVQNHTIIPGINMIIENHIRIVDGPPALKKSGKIRFNVRPAIRNGRVNRPIFLPLPTRIFNFIMVI